MEKDSESKDSSGNFGIYPGIRGRYAQKPRGKNAYYQG
jgi:hypothetical protein